MHLSPCLSSLFYTHWICSIIEQMTCESAVFVCGCVWVSQQPMSWCCSPSQPLLLSSVMSPWSLWVGYKTLPQTICCLSRMICCHPHPITTGSGISFYIGSSSPFTDKNTDPDSTNSDLARLAGMQHCCLHIVLRLTMVEYCYTDCLVAYLASPALHVSHYLISLVYILYHNLLIQNFLQWQHGAVERRTASGEKKYCKLVKRECGQNTYTVCCITKATCSKLWCPFLGLLQPLWS